MTLQELQTYTLRSSKNKLIKANSWEMVTMTTVFPPLGVTARQTCSSAPFLRELVSPDSDAH